MYQDPTYSQIPRETSEESLIETSKKTETKLDTKTIDQDLHDISKLLKKKIRQKKSIEKQIKGAILQDKI